VARDGAGNEAVAGFWYKLFPKKFRSRPIPLDDGFLQKVVPEVRAVMDSDPVANVRTRAVSGLARLPEDAAVPLLIDIVGTSKDPEVRKKAVSSLGTSKDPRAVQFLQDLVKK